MVLPTAQRPGPVMALPTAQRPGLAPVLPLAQLPGLALALTMGLTMAQRPGHALGRWPSADAAALGTTPRAARF